MGPQKAGCKKHSPSLPPLHSELLWPCSLFKAGHSEWTLNTVPVCLIVPLPYSPRMSLNPADYISLILVSGFPKCLQLRQLSLIQVGTAARCCFLRGNPWSWLRGQFGLSFCHWPPSGVDRHEFHSIIIYRLLFVRDRPKQWSQCRCSCFSEHMVVDTGKLLIFLSYAWVWVGMYCFSILFPYQKYWEQDNIEFIFIVPTVTKMFWRYVVSHTWISGVSSSRTGWQGEQFPWEAMRSDPEG
jgi:hypothetical protein